MIRAYIGTDAAQVVAWYRAGAVPAGAGVHIVTDALRADHPDADEEELEYLATRAAHVSGPDAGRPATLAVDLPADGLAHDRTRVEVPVARWAALFLDDLEWYAVEEIEHLQ